MTSSANPPRSARGRQLATNSLINLVGQILPLTIAVVALPIVVKGLGDARFGLLSLAWTFLGYFNFFDLGLGRAATKFISAALGRGDSEQAPRILVTAVQTQLLFGTIAAVILFLSTPYLVHAVLDEKTRGLATEATSVLRLVAMGMPVVMVSSSLSGALEAAQRFDLVNAVRVPSNAASFVLPLAGILLGYSLPTIVCMLLAGKAAAMLAYGILARRTLGAFGPQHGRAHLLREMLTFGGWIMVSGLTVPILAYAERLLIASKLSLAELTYYAIPFEIVSRSAVLPAALALTLFPAFSFFESASNAQLRELFARPLRYLLVALAPLLLLFVVFANAILFHWIGPEFPADGANVVRILAFCFFLNGLAQVALAAVQGLGRPDLKAKLDVVEVPVFIVSALILIPRYGVTGAALAKLAVTIVDVGGVFSFIAVASRHRITGVMHELSPLIAATATYVVGAAVTLHFMASFRLQLLGYVALSVVYFGVVWRWFTDDRDRAALVAGGHLVRRILNRRAGGSRA